MLIIITITFIMEPFLTYVRLHPTSNKSDDAVYPYHWTDILNLALP